MSEMETEPDLEGAQAFGKTIDFGRTANDYSTHRAGFPPDFFAALAARGIPEPGARALDIGTGTGTVARGLAAAGAQVTGLDPSRDLMAEAAALAQVDGLAIDWVQGAAEALDFPDASFDLVTAGQCWHWFDRPKAAAEIARVLRPSGLAVIAHFDWLPLPGNVVAATEAMIMAANPAWRMAGGTGIYPLWLADLAGAGFAGIETFSFDVAVSYSHAGWRGRIRASAGVRASLDADATTAFDAALAAMLARDFPKDPLAVPHRVWTVAARNA
ncbi:MAG: class I SAM-dependent methyltransferase [Pseudomonadota bacterium]